MGSAEIWRGGVNTWECDEMGHMNVRFYVAKAMEGLAGLARLLGMPRAFAPGSATLIVREHHMRFLREAHAGTPLHMTGGVVEMGLEDALVLQELIHSKTGQPAATFLTRVRHAAADGRDFPWPERARRLAEALAVEVPAHAAPRGIKVPAPPISASLARADELGLICIGRGGVTAADLDPFGRMRPDGFIGRVADGIPLLLAEVRKAVAETAPEQPKRVGGAVLEYRLVYIDLPRVGEHFEIRSGVSGFDEKTQRLAHWLIDPVSGGPWGVSEAVAVNFDLDARKAISIAPETRTALQRLVIPGLA